MVTNISALCFQAFLAKLTASFRTSSLQLPLRRLSLIFTIFLYQVAKRFDLAGGVARNAQFSTNVMCSRSNTHIQVARTRNNRVIAARDLYCCLLPQCEALRICCSRFAIASNGAVTRVGESCQVQTSQK